MAGAMTERGEERACGWCAVTHNVQPVRWGWDTASAGIFIHYMTEKQQAIFFLFFAFDYPIVLWIC